MTEHHELFNYCQVVSLLNSGFKYNFLLINFNIKFNGNIKIKNFFVVYVVQKVNFPINLRY